MCTPVRTRPLSIVAILSLLAFIIVAVMAVRSLWIVDAWQLGESTFIWTPRGRVYYVRYSTAGIASQSLHSSSRGAPPSDAYALEFRVKIWPNRSERLEISVPFIYLLLLLLIAPVRWLIATPALHTTTEPNPSVPAQK